MIVAVDEFVSEVLRVALECGFAVENSRNGKQINFGHKKLHEGHLRELYPNIAIPGAHIPALIENVAPGRPCTHRPMRDIVERLRKCGKL